MKTFIPPQLKGNIKPRDISHIRVSVNTHTRVLTNTHIRVLEKPLNFDPFGQIEFAPVGHNIIAPCKVLVQGPKLSGLSSL